MAGIDEILDFWFGPLDDSGFPATDRNQIWWGGGEALDSRIRQRFGALVDQALTGGLSDWPQTAEGRLALIILLDQFTRNIFRRSAQAFAGDARALALCQQGLALGCDQRLPTVQRVFFYMPLTHTESPSCQAQMLTCLSRLNDTLSAQNQAKLRGFIDSAREHQALVERFGRFPHRNRVLERPSTAQESAWLSASGRRFGQ